jgi:DMSO/TMAO reductase YedYZ molybdopterin-dependent catalytic subunit
MTDGTVTAAVPSRVQRLVGALPPVHLEAEVPEAVPGWTLRVEGLVRRPVELGLEELRRLGGREIVADHHCVWGWSRRSCRWTGVHAGLAIDLAGPLPGASTVTVACRVPPYAACLDLEDAREGILAWGLDGEDLAPENGGPLRFQNPPWLWGYKGVKWAGALVVGDGFVPGFWEAKTADPHGRVPEEVLLPFEHEERA